MHPILNIAVRAARKAGTAISHASFDIDSLRTECKQHNNFVVEVNHAAEAAIIKVIKIAYPDRTVLAEEPGQSWADGKTASENVWVIDPPDGTTSFIHSFPRCGVSIILMWRGVVTQAVVYDPTRDELLIASKGVGALLNNHRIRVTRHDKLADCLIGTGFLCRDLEGLYGYTRLSATMTEDYAGLRRPGVVALDLIHVACGRLDGFFEQGLSKWDVATGSLLVMESGGLVSSYTSESGYLDQGEILAGNPRTFMQVIKFTSPFSRSKAEA